MDAQQVAITDMHVPTPSPNDTREITVPVDFQMRPVDGEMVAQAKVFHQRVTSGNDLHATTGSITQSSSDQKEAPPTESEVFIPGSLGVLEKFVGKFEGKGFNTIFRPKSNFGTNKHFETVLELNVTSETLSFMDSAILNNIPNRGFDDQSNVMLKGVPYTQMVGDLLNEQTGKADRKNSISIHFEQGLFLRTPATENPKVGATIARLASIPHGTTINAQCLEPTLPLKGKPSIPPVSILPFGVNVDGSKGSDVTLFENPFQRVPPNMAKFSDLGTIPLPIEKNPNQVLIDANTKRTIHSHYTFTVSTTGTDELPGGGTSNIAFLMGEKPKGPPPGKVRDGEKGNAVVANMTCTYWVSTILSDVIIQAGDYHTKPAELVLLPEESKTGLAVPSFKIKLTKKVSTATKILVPWTQIQYSQNVSLDFGVLRWPHISVATLIPAKDQPLIIRADSPLLSMLK